MGKRKKDEIDILEDRERHYENFAVPKKRAEAVEELVRRIRAFLEAPVGTDQGGGYPEVTNEDYQSFDALVDAMRDLKWERDADGDPVLRITMYDASRWYQPHVPVFPHLHRIKPNSDAKTVPVSEVIRMYMNGIQSLMSAAAEAQRIFGLDLERLNQELVQETVDKLEANRWRPGSEVPKSFVRAQISYWKMEPYKPANPNNPRAGEMMKHRHEALARWAPIWEQGDRDYQWRIVGTDEVIPVGQVHGWRVADDLPDHLDPKKQPQAA